MKFEDYEKLSLVELRLAAKKLNIKSVTSYRKQELLNAVRVELDKRNGEANEADSTGNQAEESVAIPNVREETEMTDVQMQSPPMSEEIPSRPIASEEKRDAYNKKAMTRYNEKQRDMTYGNNNQNGRNQYPNNTGYNGGESDGRNYYGSSHGYANNGAPRNYGNTRSYGNNGGVHVYEGNSNGRNYGNNAHSYEGGGNGRNYGGNANSHVYDNNGGSRSYNTRNYGNNGNGRSYNNNNGSRNYGNNSGYDGNNYGNAGNGGYGSDSRFAGSGAGGYSSDYSPQVSGGNNYSAGNEYGGSNYSANNVSERQRPGYRSATEMEQLDSGEVKKGILEVLPEGYGFIRCDNYLPGDQDVYVSPAMIRKYQLRTGDIVEGNTRIRNQHEKFGALLFLKTVNGYTLEELGKRVKFEQLTPVFPDEKIRLEMPGSSISMRMMDLISPIGKGQRGMIVSQPKTGKTTLLKQVAKAVKINHPKMKIIVLLIDERPEEVTDIKESIQGHNVEVIYSTFDELPENHKRVSEMVMERAKRLVEHGEDVMILLDSITRLARAYNLTVQPSGRTLSGGLDPAALHMPKRFFGSARNMREGGSLTILATALVDTGSKMDDVVFEEFKGTGNMELVLDRKLSERRVFPSIDLPKSSTRREDLLLTQEEIEATFLMRKAFNGSKTDEAVERIIEMFRKTKNNQEFIQLVKKAKIV